MLVACGDEPPSAPSGSPSITGVVKTASAGTSGAAVGAFLIDQGTGDYDKASVAVTADTAWYRADGDKVEPIEAPTRRRAHREDASRCSSRAPSPSRTPCRRPPAG